MKNIIRKTLVVAVFIFVAGTSLECLAQNPAEDSSDNNEQQNYHWTVQAGYSAMAVAAMVADEGSDGASLAGPVHGGSVAFDYRGKGRWGVQVPVGVHFFRGAQVYDVGLNALMHFRSQGKKIDPYLILGGRVMIGTSRQYDVRTHDGDFMSSGSGSTMAFPMINVGAGLRGYFTKNVGMYVEGIASPTILPGAVAIAAEGRAGISIRF